MDAFKAEDLGYHGVAGDVAPNGTDGSANQPEHTSPDRARQELKVELPSSCDPPGPNNPPKQLVWIVSQQFCFFTVVKVVSGVYFMAHDQRHLLVTAAGEGIEYLKCQFIHI